MDGTRSGQNRSVTAGSSSSAEDKKFACTFAGCEKRFTRAEHLQRHALNHRGGSHACPRCNAAFKRPDLLDRHMNRHRQKDVEAGGEGCGILDTRKRAWKAPDGAVVSRRPNPIQQARNENQREIAEQQSAQAYKGTTGVEVSQNRQAQGQPTDFLQLPTSPVSERESDSFHDTRHSNGHIDTVVAGDQSEARLDTLLDPFLPTCSTEDPWQLWNEQPFQSDTASSFNMPYTTALDYNWLFNMSQPATNQVGFGHAAPRSAQPQNQQAVTPQSSGTTASAHAFSASSLASGGVDGNTGSMYGGDHSIENLDFASPNVMFGGATPSQVPGAVPLDRPLQPLSSSGSTPSRQPSSGPPVSDARAFITGIERPLSMLDCTTRLPSLDPSTHKRLLTIIANAKPCLPDSNTSSLPMPSSFSMHDYPPLSRTSMQTYLDLFFTRFNVTYPVIHLASFRASTVEPLLLLSIILLGATYSTKEAHQVAVCIHDVIRPSLFAHDGFSARPALWTLQAILLVECFGKSRAGQKQHDMSHLFHGLLINLIRRSDCQSVRPQGPPPTSRRLPNEQSNEATERAWLNWAEAEQKKSDSRDFLTRLRLALYCFMWDTQHAVLFCQSLCMSAFELRLQFPCSQAVWEAPDAAHWAAVWQAELSSLPPAPSPTSSPQPSLLYLPTLRAYLTPSGPPPSARLNSHARVLVLHGLMSIFWDMQRRDQTTLGTVASTVQGPSDWRDIISKAYENWKSDFDSYCSTAVRQWQNQKLYQNFHHQANLDRPSHTDFPAEMATFVASTNAVYHAAQCLLRMEFLDIQIYAGARHILGRPVQQRDYLRSAQVVRSWASCSSAASNKEDSASAQPDPQSSVVDGKAAPTSSDATGAAYHAARILRDVLPEADSDAMASLFHVPWCLYLAALTCWAFYHASPARTANSDEMSAFDNGHVNPYMDGEHGLDADEMVWDSRAEMGVLISSMTTSPDSPLRLRLRHHYPQSRRRINGLVWVVADTLTKVRWGIVHAGVMVLRGLVPSRLINQYEVDG